MQAHVTSDDGRPLRAAALLGVGALLSACQGGGEPLVVAYAAPQTGLEKAETVATSNAWT